MALKKTAEQLTRLHQRALAQFDRVQSAVRDERLQCLQDRRFAIIPGAQYEGPLGRQFENKPKIEVNKTHLAVRRVINEYRANRITVDFIPKDGSDDRLADVCDDLYRADYQDSVGDEALDNAFEEAATGGIGAWRYRADYADSEDDEDDCQCIKIEPIYDADSCVFFDLDARRQDKSDAKFCFVLTGMTPDAYEDEFGEAISDMPKLIHQSEYDWFTPDIVYIAEYYVVEERKELVHWFVGLDGEEMRVSQKELDAEEGKEAFLIATGFTKTRSKRIERKQVHKYILSGSKVLEDCGPIPGDCIPIVPVFGERQVIDGIERCGGIVKYAKDAQRLMNMLRSVTAQLAVSFKQEKPIFHPSQLTPAIAQMWADDNVKDYPYLLAMGAPGPDGVEGPAGPASYTKAPNLPPAVAALLQVVEQDLTDLLGNQQSSEEITSNISGKAVELIQNKLDMQTYVYVSNMEKAVKRGGEIWLSMKRATAVEPGRKLKTVSREGEVGSIEIYKPMIDEKTGEVYEENDLSKAKFGVVATAGPSSQSKRAAVVRALTGMLSISQDQESRSILESLAMMNMEGEGLDDVRSFYRKKMVMAGVIQPNEKEREELAIAEQNRQPDPNAVYLQAAAEKETALASKARADTVVSITNAEKNRAETIKTMVEAGAKESETLIASVGALQSAVQPINPETPQM